MQSNEPKVFTISLRRPPLWTTGLTLMVTTAAVFIVRALVDLLPKVWDGSALATDTYEAVVVVGFLLLLVVVTVGKRVLVRLRPMPPITFSDTHVSLPRSAEALRQRSVPYTEIMSVNEGGRAPRRQFFIESKRQVFHLPQEIFGEPDGPERLFLELRQRIISLPQGVALLEETERRRLAALRAMSGQPYATQAILGVIAVFFFNTYLKGAFDTPLGLLRWGANAPLLVRQGEWFRLVSANFLHGGFLPTPSMCFLHVFMNGTAIYYLGNLLERLLGWPRFLLIYLISGVVAMGASAYFAEAIMSVGASGAVFGLLGGFAMLSWRLRAHLPLGLRQPLRWWVFMLGINALLPLLWPVVDVTAHAAGFVCGCLVTLMLLGTRHALPERAGRPLTGLSVLLAAACFAALGLAVQHAARAVPDDELQFMQAAVQSPQTHPNTLNQLAWEWALNPRTTPEELETAATAAGKAVHQQPQVAEFADTAAAVAMRQGLVKEAIAHERRATALMPESPLFATRLAHFLMAHVQKDGPLLGPGVGKASVHLSVESSHGDLRLDAVPGLADSCEIYAILWRADRQVALAHIVLGPHAQAPLTYHAAELPDAPGPGSTDWRLELSLAEPINSALPTGAAHWHLMPILELTP